MRSSPGQAEPLDTSLVSMGRSVAEESRAEKSLRCLYTHPRDRQKTGPHRNQKLAQVHLSRTSALHLSSASELCGPSEEAVRLGLLPGRTESSGLLIPLQVGTFRSSHVMFSTCVFKGTNAFIANQGSDDVNLNGS